MTRSVAIQTDCLSGKTSHHMCSGVGVAFEAIKTTFVQMNGVVERDRLNDVLAAAGDSLYDRDNAACDHDDEKQRDDVTHFKRPSQRTRAVDAARGVSPQVRAA